MSLGQKKKKKERKPTPKECMHTKLGIWNQFFTNIDQLRQNTSSKSSNGLWHWVCHF